MKTIQSKEWHTNISIVVTLKVIRFIPIPKVPPTDGESSLCGLNNRPCLHSVTWHSYTTVAVLFCALHVFLYPLLRRPITITKAGLTGIDEALWEICGGSCMPHRDAAIKILMTH